jgi:hypothetical protein
MRQHKFTLTPDATCRTITCVSTSESERSSSPEPEKGRSATFLPKISRRSFARNAAAIAATSLSRAPSLLGSSASDQQQAGSKPPEGANLGLTAEGVREADARFANAIRDFGDRLSDEQRQRLRRILLYNEKMLVSIRRFQLENGDPPASVLRYVDDQTVP